MFLHADCRTVLPTLPPVDAIITSPPYWSGRGTGLGGESRPQDYVEALVTLPLPLTPHGTFWLLLGGALGIPWEVAAGFQARGWLLVQDVVWAHQHGHTPIFRFHRTPHGMRDTHSVWPIPAMQTITDTYAALPEALVARCLALSTRPGQTVLDPFAGIGTVGRVAQQQHRNFIGIECDPLTHALGSAYVSPHRN